MKTMANTGTSEQQAFLLDDQPAGSELTPAMFEDVEEDELQPMNPHGPHVQTSPGRLLAVEKAARAFELRKMNVPYAEIARRVGYKTPQGAHAAVKRYMNQIPRESRDDLRELQFERLNHLAVTLWNQAMGGNVAAANTLLGVLERIDRIQGTEAPIQHQHIVVIDGDEEQYIEKLKMMAGEAFPSEPEIMDVDSWEDDDEEDHT